MLTSRISCKMSAQKQYHELSAIHANIYIVLLSFSISVNNVANNVLYSTYLLFYFFRKKTRLFGVFLVIVVLHVHANQCKLQMSSQNTLSGTHIRMTS